MTKDWIKNVEETIAGNPDKHVLKDILTIALHNYKKSPKVTKKKKTRKSDIAKNAKNSGKKYLTFFFIL